MSEQDDLRKQAEDTFKLSYLDEFWLLRAWRVIQRKVIPKMGNWRTMLAGFCVAVAQYLQQNGMEIPNDRKGFGSLAIGALVIWWAAVQKDAATGSQPGDPPTPARIAGAIAAGETVKVDDVAKSANAIREVTALLPPQPSGG